jgi:GH25 family lysozyme M1 (1,4-beta-N-acetylmuramidase)
VTTVRAGLAGAATVTLLCTGTVAAQAAVDSSITVSSSTTAAKAGTLVRGLDISSYQHLGHAKTINWRQLARQGIRFTAVKATEGTYYRNPYYAADVRNAASAGLAVLPYVFANPAKEGGKATASYALSVVGRGHGREPVVVDLENDPYAKHAPCYARKGKRIVEWISGFVSRIHQATGRYPVIYTTATWWRTCTGSSTKFGKDPLWLASYGDKSPAVPRPWRQWAFLQYADDGKMAGIGQVDLDYYHPTDGVPSLNPKK